MEEIRGVIERVTYYNPENGYSVLQINPEERRDRQPASERLITVTGNLPEIYQGEHVTFQGEWSNHPTYGLQFKATRYQHSAPLTIDGIRKYLGSGLIKGIGNKLAERIVDQFGRDTLEIIENEPERLTEVPDIGRKRLRMIMDAWTEQRQVKEIMLFLHSHGISTNLSVKIFKTYGESALQIVRSDPYQLSKDIYGVGFKTADQIARAMGLPVDHPSRIQAGILYALQNGVSDGHTYLPVNVLIREAAALLGAADTLIEKGLNELVQADELIIEQIGGSEGEMACYLPMYYQAEVRSAQILEQLVDSAIDLGAVPLPDPGLSDEQQRAVDSILRHPVSILTGGPGTGKTTTIRVLTNALSSMKVRFALAAPTGRAAKRLSEATGYPASTIHRLLAYQPGEGFKHHQKNPLPVEFLIVDEASMLDILLSYQLVSALRPGTFVLLVGDVDQLPSVGAGDVLRELIDSEVANVSHLTQIFRQSANSKIITNAHSINQGEQPAFGKESRDFFFFSANTPEEAGDWVVDVVCQRIPRKFSLDPVEDIQVLAPMYRGPVGVDTLNERLQAQLNPGGPKRPERAFFGRTFRVGDKVMQTQNNYDKDVFNGDIGMVGHIDPEDQTVAIEIDGRPVIYEWSEMDQLVLAYAVSVHKSQGSEFKAVVIPVVTSHYIMLQRNLLYTAVTRAKELCVLVGSRKAIAIAVNNNKVNQRYSALSWRLKSTGNTGL